MKKAVLLLLMTGIAHSLPAQVLIAILFGDKLNTGKMEFGITVNPAFTNISDIESKWKPGLNLGIYFNIRPDKKFFLHVEGIAKGSFGARKIPPYPTGNDSLDNLFDEGAVQRNIKAFSLPVLGRYAISKKFFAEAGIQADLLMKVKDVFQSEVNGNELEYTIKVSDRFTKLDFGVAGGLFYKFRPDRRSMGLGFRYVQGLTDIYKAAAGKQANQAWQLLVTIPVGAAKAEASSAKKNK